MAELKSHEVLAKPRFKSKKQSFYNEGPLVSKSLSVFSPLNEDGYRVTSSFGGGIPGYVYYYYITCPIECTVNVLYSNAGLKAGDPYINYGTTDKIYFAEIHLEVFDKITDSDTIEFSIEWKESSTRIVMQECILLTGVFESDYLKYHLLHPYYYKYDQDLLLTIVDEDNTKSSRQIKWDKEGFITDPFEERFLYEDAIYKLKKRKEIQVFKNERALSSFQLTYID